MSDLPPDSEPVPTERPVRRQEPKGPSVLPDWGGLGSRTFARSSPDYFDAAGNPQVASAREISPEADNPLWWWQRLGAAIFWRSARLERVFPRNVRSNPVLFYLTGRLRGRWWEDLIAFAPWIPLLVLDLLLGFLAIRALLNPGLMTSYTWMFFSIVFLEVILLMPIVGAVGQLMVLFHLSRLRTGVPFDELSVSRLSDEEILYGLLARPVANQHFANFGLLAVSVLGALLTGSISIILVGSMLVEVWLNILIIPLLLIGLAFRWLIFAVSIDIGAATSLRAFLFIRGTSDRVRRALWDWLRVGGGFPVLSPIVAMLLMAMFVASTTYGCFISCFVLILIGFVAMMWVRYIREIPIYAGNILGQTAAHSDLWWVRTGEDLPADHVAFRD